MNKEKEESKSVMTTTAEILELINQPTSQRPLITNNETVTPTTTEQKTNQQTEQKHDD